MSRWFRFYDDAINDAKVLRLSDAHFRAWVTLLCFASKNNGELPPAADIALILRTKTSKVAEWLTVLTSVGLMDNEDGRFKPHNWSARQFRSDVSTDRVKRFRNGKRNVSPDVSETPPYTEAETEAEKTSEANASGADTPIDHRKRLFDEGLPKFARMTGKGPDSCRSFLGKCLAAAGDSAVVVLGLIEDADRNQVADPAAWISARLKGAQGAQGNKIIQAADNLIQRVAGFDGPPGAGGILRSGEGQAAPRLLSHR